MRVWVTRAEPGALATAARLRARGHDPLVAPLIATTPLSPDPPDADAFAALAFTSAAGVRTFAALLAARDAETWRRRLTFTVGDATAAAARAAGWRDVRSADGDGRALAATLLAAPPAGAVLIAGAREPAFDLAGALAAGGVAARMLPVYATAPVDPPPPEPLVALRAGALDAVLLHAPSAARALDAAVPCPRAEVLVACLSAACRPASPGWRIAVARSPRETELLRLLDAPNAAALPLDSPPSPR